MIDHVQDVDAESVVLDTSQQKPIIVSWQLFSICFVMSHVMYIVFSLVGWLGQPKQCQKSLEGLKHSSYTD